MNKKDKCGFTLIEIIFVIVILAILIGIVSVTYPRLMHDMKIRSDRASATHIAKALRVWYEDYMSDPVKRSEFESFISTDMTNKTVKLSDLSAKGVDTYLDTYFSSYSLLDENKQINNGQAFYVGLIDAGVNARFAVSIETEIDRIGTIDNTMGADYDGYSPGIIYIER